MNKARRKTLDELHSNLEALLSDLTTVRDEEQEAFDNLSENLQSGERGEAMQTAISSMETAIDNIESAMAEIETAKE